MKISRYPPPTNTPKVKKALNTKVISAHKIRDRILKIGVFKRFCNYFGRKNMFLLFSFRRGQEARGGGTRAHFVRKKQLFKNVQKSSFKK